uniref:[histone H4]-lysine(20) N-methyltransferase n=1 Tax=Strongyloides papillosus TaxID=174720 RepID=A0A0N5CB51_STREA
MIVTNINVKRCLSLKSEVPEKNKCTPKRRGIRYTEDAICVEEEKGVSVFSEEVVIVNEDKAKDASDNEEVIPKKDDKKDEISENVKDDEKRSADVHTTVNKDKEIKPPSATNILTRKKASSRSKKGNRCKENRPPKIIKDEATSNHKITEYFQVRKSTRKTASQIEKEKKTQLEYEICSRVNEEFLEIFTDKVKGRGCKTKKLFKRGDFVIEYIGTLLSAKAAKKLEKEYKKDESLDFVIEYIGTLLSAKAAKKLEKEYKKDESLGSYMYYFNHKGQNWCVDATKESPFKARLINHSCLRPNLKTKVVDIGDKFHLIMIALRDIDVGEELLYDYGDRTPESVANNPWLKNS